MINLTNHSCSHCKHLDRHSRTRHGYLADYVRSQQIKLEEYKKSRDLDMVGYIQKEINRNLEAMKNIERGTGIPEWDKYFYMNRRHRGKRFYKLVLY